MCVYVVVCVCRFKCHPPVSEQINRRGKATACNWLLVTRHRVAFLKRMRRHVTQERKEGRRVGFFGIDGGRSGMRGAEKEIKLLTQNIRPEPAITGARELDLNKYQSREGE